MMHRTRTQIIALLFSIIVFPLSAGAVTIGGSVTVIKSGTIPAHSKGSAFVACPIGTVALSGGIQLSSPAARVAASAPTFGGSDIAHALQSLADGSNLAPDGWYAWARNDGDAAVSAWVVAICGAFNGVSASVVSQTNSSISFDTLSASCPSGTVATGGGVDASDPNNILVNALSPLYPDRLLSQANGIRPAPVGWRAGIQNVNVGTGTVKAAAICAPLSGVVSMVVSSDVAVSATNIVPAQCPAGSVALGGGVDADGGLFFYMNGNYFAYSNGDPSSRADGQYEAAASWIGAVRNLGSSVQTVKSAAVCAIGTFTVVEYYWPNGDNYFITADPGEQAALDAMSDAAGAGLDTYNRTGVTFKAGGLSPVCRFFGNTNIDPATHAMYGPISHFFTVLADECSTLQARFNPNALSWKLESPAAFYMTPPTVPGIGGSCPAGTLRVYRAFNNSACTTGTCKPQPNHRLTIYPGGISEVVVRGWKSEGVTMCAPQ